MQTYYFRRYHRTGPGHATGTLIDEVEFRAGSAAEAETSVRRRFSWGFGAIDWEKEFVRLEDEYGHGIVEWLKGFAHA
jgi:hypothetical protein